jgi:hypothetical protein
MKSALTFRRIVRRMSGAERVSGMDAKYNKLIDNPYFMTTVNCVAFALWFWISFALLS